MALSTHPLCISSQGSSMQINSWNTNISTEKQKGQEKERNLLQQVISQFENLKSPITKDSASLLVSPSGKQVIAIRPNSIVNQQKGPLALNTKPHQSAHYNTIATSQPHMFGNPT